MASSTSAGAVSEPQRYEASDVDRINFSWLVRLRWAAIAGKAGTVFIVSGPMNISLPVVPIVGIIVLEAVSNLLCAIGQRRWRVISERLIGSLMILDVGLFTALLYFSGGPFNPFSFLYLVYIALAALVLPPGWTWTLVLAALCGSAALFFHHVPLPMSGGEHSHVHHHGMSMHLRGMWVAFGVAAAFIVYFLRRVKTALAEREAELAQMREQRARAERLASVATLAAGAAHELSTPLATIAVIAKELELASGDGAREDARLIREQVERCRNILRQMAGDAGESPGESAAPVSVERLVEEILKDIPQGERVRVELSAECKRRQVTIPLRAVAQALRGVVKNGIDATGADGRVTFRVSVEQGQWCFFVEDDGTGMTDEVQARAAEPFFTTKQPGRGMGLGLFLTRTVFDFLGGTFSLQSAPGQGTRAALTLPATIDRTRENPPFETT